MNIVIGSLSHESNSFNPALTTLEDFSPVYGHEILSRLEAGGHSPLHGIYQVMRSQGVNVLPTIFARATPGGLVSLEAYEAMKAGLLKELSRYSNIDGVCLHLHGSMTVEGIGDGEGDLLTAIRAQIGNEIPLVASLDMHATITETMLAKADAFVAFRTAPHVDTKETGAKAAQLLLNALKEGYKPTMCAVGLPLLVSGEQSESAKEPMASLVKRLEQTDAEPAVLSSSLLLGFPWVDVSFNQGAALVVTRGDSQLAERYALELAEEFWSRLDQFTFTTEAYPFPEALAVALSLGDGPVCIADCGDNPGAGGSQDIVYPLQVCLEQKLDNILFGAIADRSAYEECLGRELGSSFPLSFGRLTIHPNAPGITVIATLKAMGKLGQTPAVLINTGGIDVIISKARVMMLDPQDLNGLNVDVMDYRILILKSGYLDPKYEAAASHGLLALTPGFTNQEFADLNYKNVTRPIYPLDRCFPYNPRQYLLHST